MIHWSYGLGQKHHFSHELALFVYPVYLLPVQHFLNTPLLQKKICLILGEDRCWGLTFCHCCTALQLEGSVAMQRPKQGYAQKYEVWSLTAFELSVNPNLLQGASLGLTVPPVLDPTAFHSALWRLQGDVRQLAEFRKSAQWDKRMGVYFISLFFNKFVLK